MPSQYEKSRHFAHRANLEKNWMAGKDCLRVLSMSLSWLITNGFKDNERSANIVAVHATS